MHGEHRAHLTHLAPLLSPPLCLAALRPTLLTPDSRLDLWERRLKEQSKRIRKRAAELVPKGLRTPRGSMVVLDDSDNDSTASGKLTKRAARHRRDVERELSRLKVNIADRVNKLSASWASDKVVRTREKFCEWHLRRALRASHMCDSGAEKA